MNKKLLIEVTLTSKTTQLYDVIFEEGCAKFYVHGTKELVFATRELEMESLISFSRFYFKDLVEKINVSVFKYTLML